jgi:hypothetical protein
MRVPGGTTNRRAAFLVEHGDQRFAHLQFGDCLLNVELGIRAQRRRGRLDRLLVAWREGAQRVLHSVAELPEDGIRDVERVLGHEVDADALGADEPHHLLDLFQQGRGRVVEEQVRLVEKEH